MSLSVLIVDDERLARERLQSLLARCVDPPVRVVGEAANAVQAMAAVQREGPDLLLLDVHMPGLDGMELAKVLRQLEKPPAVVFVTAFAEHAVQAFELEAADYLTKPVRLARLQLALQKVMRTVHGDAGASALAEQDAILIQDRGRTERVPVSEVIYLKAELKYLTVRTLTQSFILDASLNDIEERYAGRFLRIHRNAVVARRAIRALEKQQNGDEVWVVRLFELDETLVVSRRQLGLVREAITGK